MKGLFFDVLISSLTSLLTLSESGYASCITASAFLATNSNILSSNSSPNSFLIFVFGILMYSEKASIKLQNCHFDISLSRFKMKLLYLLFFSLFIKTRFGFHNDLFLQ